MNKNKKKEFLFKEGQMLSVKIEKYIYASQTIEVVAEKAMLVIKHESLSKEVVDVYDIQRNKKVPYYMIHSHDDKFFPTLEKHGTYEFVLSENNCQHRTTYTLT